MTITLTELARGVFSTQLQEMQLHLDGCIEGEDPIHLHDLRVANRRTRAALNEFRELFSDQIYQKYQDDFRWIQKATGKVRDLDVGISRFPEFRKEIPKRWRRDLKPLRKLQIEKRYIAQEDLSLTLQSARLKAVFASWSEVLENDLVPGSALSLEPAREYGCRRIIKRYRQLQNHGVKLTKTTPAKNFHDYRILVKKSRYLMDFFRPVMDQEAFERIRNGLRSVQDTFGIFQDSEIQSITVRKLAVELYAQGVTADTMLALGQLLGVLEKSLSKGKKECLKKTRWLISDATAQAFQTCFQYPVD